jgi:hypothetical protein
MLLSALTSGWGILLAATVVDVTSAKFPLTGKPNRFMRTRNGK